MIEIQEIESPKNGLITRHIFSTYNPVNDFNIKHSLLYLTEDLFQCYFPQEDIKIDLGWYGKPQDNEGEFRIYIIQSENWEFPVEIVYSKDVVEIKTLLENVLTYFAYK
ncbi:MAG: hypothetical protein ABF242_07915 [Flavobacteriales bacterium]